MAEDSLQGVKRTAERRNEPPEGGGRHSEVPDELTAKSAVTHKSLPIQCLRGIAALFVALFHECTYYVALFLIFWPSSSGVGAAWLSALAAALIVSAGFGMLDVRMYRHLKNAVDNAEEEYRRRRVSIYAGTFIAASLVGLVIGYEAAPPTRAGSGQLGSYLTDATHEAALGVPLVSGRYAGARTVATAIVAAS